MNEQKHTPGPWTVQTLSESWHDYSDWKTFAVRSPRNVCLAVVGDVDRFESERIPANAQLISAAPDMLAALQECKCVLETACRYFPKSINNWDKFQLINVMENAVKKAIAKATGN